MDDSDVTLIERYRWDFDGNSASSSIFELCAIDAGSPGLAQVDFGVVGGGRDVMQQFKSRRHERRHLEVLNDVFMLKRRRR
jgi:hypothetical protein